MTQNDVADPKNVDIAASTDPGRLPFPFKQASFPRIPRRGNPGKERCGYRDGRRSNQGCARSSSPAS